MIRKNYSLADDQRRFEKQQQSKVQNRQKRAHMMAKLEKADPGRIRRKILTLEKQEQDLQAKEKAYLGSLREDWKFIRKNNLHSEQVESILQKEKEYETKKKESQSKLWGKNSVYFNPELNPLGKVPPGMPNVTIQKLHHKTSYPDDPRITELDIVLPVGEPPRFYKKVQNYLDKKERVDLVEVSEKLTELVPTSVKRRKVATYQTNNNNNNNNNNINDGVYDDADDDEEFTE